MTEIEVRTHTVHSPANAPALPTITLDLLEEEITVRELIKRTVEEQVRELLVARRLDAALAQRALNMQYSDNEPVKEQKAYLTTDEIQSQAATGIVRLPTQKTTAIPSISTTTEVRKALTAFQKRLYRIIIDGRLVERLDEKLVFKPGSKVTFIRLVPLVGG